MTANTLNCDPRKLATMIEYDPMEMAPSFLPEIVQAHLQRTTGQQNSASSSQDSGTSRGMERTGGAAKTERIGGIGGIGGTTSGKTDGVATSVASVANGVATLMKNTYVNTNSYSRVANVADVAGGSGETPIPLRSMPQMQMPFPVEGLGPFSGAVKALAQKVKVPEAMAGSSVLTALAFCTQKLANVSMKDGRTIPLSLYCLTVGDSGDRKTGVDKIVYEPIKTIERELYTQYQVEEKQYSMAKESYESLSRKDKELCSFEMEAPKNPTMLKEDVTIEGLFKSLKDGQPSLALFSDEGGMLFGGHSMKKDTALKSITFFSKLWDGSELDKVRSGEDFARLYDRRLSMHLMVQPVIVKEIFSNPLFQGQGFLPRFLFAWPQSLKGTRTYEESNVRHDEYVQYFFKVCEYILRMPIQTDTSNGAIQFNTIMLDRDAHALWVDHHDRIERLLTPDGDFTIISANVSKCAEQSLRIAGVLTLAENPHASLIPYESMYNAIQLSEWYLKEALRVQQDGSAGEHILRAEKLLDWLQAKQITLFTKRQLMQNAPNALRVGTILEECFHTLEQHKFIRRGLGEGFVNGRVTKDFWEVVSCA